jgi:hypothetical protein
MQRMPWAANQRRARSKNSTAVIPFWPGRISTKAKLPADVTNRRPRLHLPQRVCDLLLGEFRPLHPVPPLPVEDRRKRPRYSSFDLPRFRGGRQTFSSVTDRPRQSSGSLQKIPQHFSQHPASGVRDETHNCLIFKVDPIGKNSNRGADSVGGPHCRIRRTSRLPANRSKSPASFTTSIVLL